MSSDFKFIDLFAGIGGIRIAFERNNGKCVFSSEYDKFSQLTYQSYFKERPIFELKDGFDLHDGPAGDITKLSNPELIKKYIPVHDILTGGFPCQPFSLAGVSKKNSLGRPHGFNDPTQGTLFFNIKLILETLKPKAFLLENVKNLKNHDKGKTFKIIKNTFSELGYISAERIIDGKGWVPQHRERIYMIGIKIPHNDEYKNISSNELNDTLDAIKPPEGRPSLKSILEKSENIPEKYTLGKGTWETLQKHKKHHESIGQGFGYGLIDPQMDNTTRTLSARYHKDGAEILVDQSSINQARPRRLTPLECSRLMGFPEDMQKLFSRKNGMQPVSDTQAYRQFGNSVVVPVVEEVARALVGILKQINAI